MRILYVTNLSPWPANMGNQVRMNGVCRGLSRQHQLTYALANDAPSICRSFVEKCESGWDIHALKREPASRRDLLSDRFCPGTRRYLRPRDHNAFRSSFLRLCSELKPDTVFCFQTPTYWRIGNPPEGIPIIFDVDDLESKKNDRIALSRPPLTRLLMLMDGSRIRRMERDMLRASQVVVLSNPDDVVYARSAASTPTVVVPNGFDFPDRLHTKPRPSRRMVMFGLLTNRPTRDGLIWFIGKVWPSIRKAVPDACLELAGHYPPEMEELRDVPGVTVHGFVDDLDPLLSECAFLIVPIHSGAGTRIKIIEAWSKGLPVVSTTIGCEGLGAADGETVVVGDTPKEFAARCVDLLNRPEMGAELAGRAFDHGRANFDWQAIFPTIEQAVDLAVSTGMRSVGAG